MPDYIIREYLPEDIPALTALWAEVFGDPEKLVSEFFRLLPSMGGGLAAVRGGRVVGSAYVITGMELVGSDAEASVCGYIYAVAVDAGCRRLGIGRELVSRAAALAYKLGAKTVCVLPAEKSLYKLYGDAAGLCCALHRRSKRVKSKSAVPCCELSPAEYMSRREALLHGRIYMRPSAPALEFTHILCREYGGGLYACGSGIAAAYRAGACLAVTELICPDGSSPDASAASLGAFLGADDVLYWLPAPDGEAFLAAIPGTVPAECIWNLAFSEGEELFGFS